MTPEILYSAKKSSKCHRNICLWTYKAALDYSFRKPLYKTLWESSQIRNSLVDITKSVWSRWKETHIFFSSLVSFKNLRGLSNSAWRRTYIQSGIEIRLFGWWGEAKGVKQRSSSYFQKHTQKGQDTVCLKHYTPDTLTSKVIKNSTESKLGLRTQPCNLNTSGDWGKRTSSSKTT